VWMLFPHVYKVDAEACPPNSRTATEAECFAAAGEALALGSEPHFDAPVRTLKSGSFSNSPSGCTVNTASARVVYNTHVIGKASSTYRIVCTTPTFPAAANFSTVGGTGRLCPRKRMPCQVAPSPGQGCQEDSISSTVSATYHWSEEPCRVQVQVHVDGRVARVDVGSTGSDPMAVRMQPDSENWFRVRWRNNTYPTASAGCAEGCDVRALSTGDTCLCDVAVTTRAVFTNATDVPGEEAVVEQLRIGAPPLAHFDDGDYSQCSTAACQTRLPYVKVYTRGTATTPIFDDRAIFEVVANRSCNLTVGPSAGRTVLLMNRASTISIANAGNMEAFSFRNPPQFMKLIDATQRDALYETDALLNHLFFHPNLAPFLAIRLSQRLVTSNGSPRYITKAVAAFRSGKYGGHTFTGRYGDLGAMVAAILLDREARSLVLAADPTHGQVREPIVKLMHVLRALEAKPRNDRDLELDKEIITKLGQAPYRSPSVFNFFQPEYSPSGPVDQIGLLAPEAQLGVLPFVVGYMDGITTMIFDGLSSCAGGLFGGPCTSPSNAAWSHFSSNGYLSYTPNATSASGIIDELSVLLTAGRLDDQTKAIIVHEFLHARNRSMCPNDRSMELCGRLTPGQELMPGDFIVNALGETLCFSHDGVATLVGTDGQEVFSTAPDSREVGESLLYKFNGRLVVTQGSGSAWSSLSMSDGNNGSFFSFMNGECMLQDPRFYERAIVYRMRSTDSVPIMLTCNAESTCGLAALPPRSADYMKQRAQTDAAHAVKVAQLLILQSAAFATTNDPATLPQPVVPPPQRISLNRPYRALVIFFLKGGADTFNMLVPRSGCDARQINQQYTSTRGAVAVALEQTHEIDVPRDNHDHGSMQPCTKFGIHRNLPTLQRLYNNNQLSFLANIGSLMGPITKQQYIDGAGKLPPQLFAHNTQQKGAISLDPISAHPKGIVGRIFKALDEQAHGSGVPPLKTASYSISNENSIFRGAPIDTVSLSSSNGMLTYDGSKTALITGNVVERNRTLSALGRLIEYEAGSMFADAHNQAMRMALRDSERVSKVLERVSLTQDWAQVAGRVSNPDVVSQLEQVSNVIASRVAFEAERDVFYVELTGFDTHSNLVEQTEANFFTMDSALETFVNEMKAQGAWEQVTLLSLSDFGRTMTTNGRGTDHGWGANHFILGGNVRGGVIHGLYPELRVDGPNSISSTGQMLPTTPWEGIWRALSLWLGVREDMLGTVMPNLQRFTSSHLLNQSIVFQSI